MMVIRYDPEIRENFDSPYGYMEPYTSGDYVTYEDYETLARQYDDLQDKYDSLVKKLGELYQEG